MSAVLAGPAARAPGPLAGPPLLVGERPRRRFWSSRRSAVAVPLTQRLPRALGTLLVFGFFGLTGATGAVLGGHTETLRQAQGEPRHMIARLFGLGIDRVTISGLAELSEMEVLVAAGIDPKISVPFFDAVEARRRLEDTPLIREATVRKLYPGEISIAIVERGAFALWQIEGELFVIAADGTVIDRMDDGRFAHLPFVVGKDANTRAAEYIALLKEAGPIGSRIRAGSLVSGRRWTLKLDNGLDVRLPEIAPERAVQRLAALEKDARILDRDVLAIDLRQPDRVVMRLSEEAASARAEQLKAKAKKKAGEA